MEGTGPSANEQIASPRRAPSQQRSRERVERMLAAASALIAEQGSDAMRMGEVAERAGVSIGSLYQFFPDKRAIVWALAERYTAESQACISSALKDVGDAEGLRQAFSELVDIYYGLFLAEPVMRDIWSGTQADKALRELELADRPRQCRIPHHGAEAIKARRRCGGAGDNGVSGLADGRGRGAAGDLGRAR